MSITFDEIAPVLERELGREPAASREAVRRAIAAARATIAGMTATADAVVEDASGKVVLLEFKPGSGKIEQVVSGLLAERLDAAILTGPVAGALGRAMSEWQRQNGSYRDVLEALAPRERGSLSASGLLQARRNAHARRELLEEFPALTSAEVADAARSKATNRASLANRWREERRVFAIRVGEPLLYPQFQFDEDGRPLAAVGRALELLDRDRLSDWQIALWFTSPNGWLGGRRPVDALNDDPDAVAGAAARETGELVA